MNDLFSKELLIPYTPLKTARFSSAHLSPQQHKPKLSLATATSPSPNRSLLAKAFDPIFLKSKESTPFLASISLLTTANNNNNAIFPTENELKRRRLRDVSDHAPRAHAILLPMMNRFIAQELEETQADVDEIRRFKLQLNRPPPPIVFTTVSHELTARLCEELGLSTRRKQLLLDFLCDPRLQPRDLLSCNVRTQHMLDAPIVAALKDRPAVSFMV